MREVTLRIRHHGEPESEVSAQFPMVTIQSVSALTGSTAERKRIYKIIGPEKDINEFITTLQQEGKVCDAKLLSLPKNGHAFVTISLSMAINGIASSND